MTEQLANHPYLGRASEHADVRELVVHPLPRVVPRSTRTHRDTAGMAYRAESAAL